MDQYFNRIDQNSKAESKYPPRIRFMLRDLIELRRNDWVPRKLVNTEGPVPMQQLRPDDDVIHSPFASRNQRDQRNTDRDNDSWMSKMQIIQPNVNHNHSPLIMNNMNMYYMNQTYNSPVGGNYNNRDYRDGGNNTPGSGNSNGPGNMNHGSGGSGGGYRHNNNLRNNQSHGGSGNHGKSLASPVEIHSSGIHIARVHLFQFPFSLSCSIRWRFESIQQAQQ